MCSSFFCFLHPNPLQSIRCMKVTCTHISQTSEYSLIQLYLPEGKLQFGGQPLVGEVSLCFAPNCGISYFILDDIAALAGSADRQNVDPPILSDICHGLKYENSYCRDLRFLGVEARHRAEGNIVIPRMVDQVQHFDVCSVRISDCLEDDDIAKAMSKVGMPSMRMKESLLKCF